MDSVFLVQHLHVLPDGSEDVKVIGIYRNRASAEAAMKRLGSQPGFEFHSNFADPDAEGVQQGFYIDEYLLDQDHWVEGYITT
jgi:hypothetical protein